ncbi:type I-E CRISPR-associated protein Cas7/Cse4/CasC [Desulfatiglans anilini]|uniref:CRISPR-associated protein, Cse4 family n=1 Tax=Uncultured Desulfatiglans sp. TaxID=1748965 RepID=A0A653AA97_UNCDX|nr:type I-E CRISPR-associated protein Cas7/Cse4/CasC [Desulfatiglans anilini]VBB44900.1 CRISPR-associated protein, Cse4 family [uncultured Desulfatiglans sp.]
MFLQIHTLTSYAPALLNRDDAGLAKRIPFGNAERMRVSSQCLKKHWRDELHRRLDLPKGIRSRMFFEREVWRRAVTAGVDEETAMKLVTALMKALITAKDGKAKQTDGNPLHLKQPVLFGKPEADYLVSLVTDCAGSGKDPDKELKERLKAEKYNLRALMKSAGQDDLVAGIEGALFGRFVTSDILARVDASVHVAHAFTVHPLQTEVDYFTVVDDLKEELEHAGAAHAGDMELGAGVFYGYVVVDVPLLISNLCGCDRSAWKAQPQETVKDGKDVLERLINAIATVSPGAKLGSTAPYARAALVLLECGEYQPRTLANAYLEALLPKGDIMQTAVDRLGVHLSELDGMYGRNEERFIASTKATSAFQEALRGTLAQSVEGSLGALWREE